MAIQPLTSQPRPNVRTGLPVYVEGQALADLQRLLVQTDAAIAERPFEELKVLADGYAKKLAMNGFSIREGMDALKPNLRIKSFASADRLPKWRSTGREESRTAVPVG